ncbi:hypothetical protein EDC01DRAFT_447711 [Geopyxis carbonaria]|nr:hypothetical protein EDC01DRAFT_447711 [Geopyxis carbonaria]
MQVLSILSFLSVAALALAAPTPGHAEEKLESLRNGVRGSNIAVATRSNPREYNVERSSVQNGESLDARIIEDGNGPLERRGEISHAYIADNGQVRVPTIKHVNRPVYQAPDGTPYYHDFHKRGLSTQDKPLPLKLDSQGYAYVEIPNVPKSRNTKPLRQTNDGKVYTEAKAVSTKPLRQTNDGKVYTEAKAVSTEGLRQTRDGQVYTNARAVAGPRN